MTLGVYLGLVLVDATPQVLANAATTRNFDIRDEIEFQDKVDKDPDLQPSPRSIVDDKANVKRDKFVPLARLFKQLRPILPVSFFSSTFGTPDSRSVKIPRIGLLYNDVEAR